MQITERNEDGRQDVATAFLHKTGVTVVYVGYVCVCACMSVSTNMQRKDKE